LNNGATFTVSGVETIKAANGVATVTVGAALLDGTSYIIDHATLSDTFDATVELGTATSLDLSNLVVNSANLTTADSFVVAAGSSTSALTLTGADGMEADFTTGSGADTLTGGTGNDTFSAGTGDDTISGENGDDSLTGGAGNDTINGGAGNDNITGGTGVDTMTGGAGNDTYDFDASGEVGVGESIVEAASGGTDVINVDATVDFTNMSAASFDEIEQIDIADSITATYTGEQLTGETIELETASAGTGTAMVVNVAFGETADMSGVTATSNWTAGEDTITINGLGGNETITGTAENDAINLGAGADTLKIAFGGAGVDTITGFTGGADADVLDFTGTIDVNDAAGGDLDVDGFLLFANTDDLALADGLTVFSGASTTAIDAGAQLTAAEIATFLGDLDGSGTGTDNHAVTVATKTDVAYVLVEGAAGTSTLAQVTGGADTTIDSADVTLIAHFTAFESEDFLAANASDFA